MFNWLKSKPQMSSQEFLTLVRVMSELKDSLTDNKLKIKVLETEISLLKAEVRVRKIKKLPQEEAEQKDINNGMLLPDNGLIRGY